MITYDTQQPYIACFIVLRKADTIAMVHRQNTAWMNGHWGLPSGKVEVGESFSAGAVRELQEETGITVTQSDLQHLITMHRHSIASNGEYMEWVDVYFSVDSWSGELVNAEPHMHSEVAWIDSKQLPENTIPSVRASLTAAARGERYVEFGFDGTIEA